MPTDGDWDEAHPYFCADCGHQLGTERGFRIFRLARWFRIERILAAALRLNESVLLGRLRNSGTFLPYSPGPTRARGIAAD